MRFNRGDRMCAGFGAVGSCALALALAACGPQPDPELVEAAELMSAQEASDQNRARAETVPTPDEEGSDAAASDPA